MEPSEYRRVIGNFATGVTVITTAVDGWLHGMTANAVVSVSLDPLLLLVSVEKSAHAHDQIEQAGSFGVNVLSRAQEGLSKLFAVTGPPEEGQLRGAPFRLGPHETPLLDGCIAYLECRVRETFTGGDHTLFLADVLGGASTGDDDPLLFYQGKYRALGVPSQGH